MKEKIQLLSRGVFDYENPVIDLSETSINLVIESGQQYSGYFDISSRNHIEIRTMIFSSNKRMRCLESTFIGMKGRVHYTFDTDGMNVDEKSEGEFILLSNGGEIRIPFTVHVRTGYCLTSKGKVSDLDQFAQLAEDEWPEAVKLFKTSDFERVFLNNKKNQSLYDSLMKNGNTALAMEEFLCAIKRKQPVIFSVSKDQMEFQNLTHMINDMLVIERSQWGYMKINVRTEGNFLTVYKKVITDEDFLGSFYCLEYEVRPKKGTFAKGKIILESFNQKVEIPIVCKREKRGGSLEDERYSVRKSWSGLMKLYLEWQMKKISLEEWRTAAREEIDGCTNNSRDVIYRVVEADYLSSIDRFEEASMILNDLNGQELRYHSAIAYSYYLYVNARCKQDEQYTDFVRDTIWFYRDGQYQDSWELLYMLIQLDQRKEEHYPRYFRDIKEIYEHGLMGGFLYKVAADIINEDPTMLREVGEFEIGLFLWGVRHEYLKRETILRFADISGRMRRFHSQCLYTMMILCDIYQTKEMLTAVLHMLVLGEKKEKAYHRWYELGIRSAIKMPELYEYYLATMDLSKHEELPLAVLIYFQYDRSLGEEQKAFIYRYIVEHKEQQPRIFAAYKDMIEAFILEQLKKAYINQNMAVLYDYYLQNYSVTATISQYLSGIIFKHQLHCEHERIKAVIVEYAELEDEYYYPMENSDAWIDLFMDDYRIILVDEDANRYTSTIVYTVTRLLDAGRYVKEYGENCRGDEMLMNRSERAMKYQMVDEASIVTYREVLHLEKVKKPYKRIVLKSLIDYYEDTFEGETLEKHLQQIDIQLLGDKERVNMIEYYIQRGLFSKAYKAVQTYGYAGIQDKWLMRLASRVIRDNEYEKDDFVVALAFEAFSNGKYDETILQYLIRFYMGTLEELYAIWEAAKAFEIMADELEERLICAILFSEAMVEKGCEVFASYYNGHPGQRLVKAFLGYFGYHYLIFEEFNNQKVFHIMEIELDQLEQSRDLCSLALLKHYAGSNDIESGYYEKLQKEVGYFMNKGILLPFFKKYAGATILPEELVDFTYVEYHANPGATVKIHYQLSGKKDNTFDEAPMRHVLGGIFIKTFRLFDDEELTYYITEDDNSKITDHYTIKADNDLQRKTGISRLNQMLEYASMLDDQALTEALTDYDREEAMVSELFDLK